MLPAKKQAIKAGSDNFFVRTVLQSVSLRVISSVGFTTSSELVSFPPDIAFFLSAVQVRARDAV